MKTKFTQIELGKTYKAVSGISGIAVCRSEHYSGCCQIAIQPKAKLGDTKEPQMIWVAESFALGLLNKGYNPPPRHPALGKHAKAKKGELQIQGKVVTANTWWPEGTTKLSIEDPTLNQDRKVVHHSFHLDEIEWEGKASEPVAVKPGGPTNDRLPEDFRGA
jgi:hypothetical protein